MRRGLPVLPATPLGFAFVAVLRVPGVSDLATSLISNLGQLLSAVLASLGCAIAGRRTSGRRRGAWRWLAVGTGVWAAGQAA